ncbi:hypothetical protein TGPRC2_286525 [Toxoplasma gondii TgCatPRC2]|uniref:Uncharacterized protein n=1 Tax=Toxoplasma gondii TgCatPRC2 TaxID=1130821 RepID=A0A151HHN5_TOXGO|nr:hypothetical protein TGPRC2_286525 [Toxoplasma gondii TgCatPRC2]
MVPDGDVFFKEKQRDKQENYVCNRSIFIAAGVHEKEGCFFHDFGPQKASIVQASTPKMAESKDTANGPGLTIRLLGTYHRYTGKVPSPPLKVRLRRIKHYIVVCLRGYISAGREISLSRAYACETCAVVGFAKCLYYCSRRL